MALNYAETYEKELLDIIIGGSYSSPFITSNVKWLNSNTFNFTQMSVSGYKNHSRSGGWNSGTIAQTNKAFTVSHDRDIQFLVDKADVDETARTAAIENVSKTFTQTQQTPEVDALFFEKVATTAIDKSLCGSSALTAYAKDKCLTQLKTDINKVRRYKNKGLICYVCPDIMDNLQMSTEISKTINVTTIAEKGNAIETRVAMIDGVPIMEVIDTDRFYTEFEYDGDDGGYTPKVGAYPLYVCLATPMTTKTVPKISSIYYFNAGDHTNGDGDLYQNRSLWDTFVFPNGKDGEIDSVYCVRGTTAVTAPSNGS